MKKSLFLTTAIFAFVFLLCNQPLLAAKAGIEGKEWLSWNGEMKTLYVRAYVTGMQKGWGRACGKGADLAVPDTYDAQTKFRRRCWESFPFLHGDPIDLVPLVTSFYKTYPEQIKVDIGDVLIMAGKTSSIDEIHRHFLRNPSPW
jgi:hypothetical protein